MFDGEHCELRIFFTTKDTKGTEDGKGKPQIPTSKRETASPEFGSQRHGRGGTGDGGRKGKTTETRRAQSGE